MQTNESQTDDVGELNQTLLQTASSWLDAPLNIYDASVGGVMLVGAIFTCGLIMALAYVCWQIVNGMADSTLEGILCCITCVKNRCRGRQSKPTIEDMDDNDDDDAEDADDEDESEGKFPRASRKANLVAE